MVGEQLVSNACYAGEQIGASTRSEARGLGGFLRVYGIDIERLHVCSRLDSCDCCRADAANGTAAGVNTAVAIQTVAAA